MSWILSIKNNKESKFIRSCTYLRSSFIDLQFLLAAWSFLFSNLHLDNFGRPEFDCNFNETKSYFHLTKLLENRNQLWNAKRLKQHKATRYILHYQINGSAPQISRDRIEQGMTDVGKIFEKAKKKNAYKWYIKIATPWIFTFYAFVFLTVHHIYRIMTCKRLLHHLDGAKWLQSWVISCKYNCT